MDRALGGRTPTYDDIRALGPLEACMKEVLRLYPAAGTGIVRMAPPGGIELGGSSSSPPSPASSRGACLLQADCAVRLRRRAAAAAAGGAAAGAPAAPEPEPEA
eukprot:tig00021438_g21449.t1